MSKRSASPALDTNEASPTEQTAHACADTNIVVTAEPPLKRKKTEASTFDSVVASPTSAPSPSTSAAPPSPPALIFSSGGTPAAALCAATTASAETEAPPPLTITRVRATFDADMEARIKEDFKPLDPKNLPPDAGIASSDGAYYVPDAAERASLDEFPPISKEEQEEMDAREALTFLHSRYMEVIEHVKKDHAFCHADQAHPPSEEDDKLLKDLIAALNEVDHATNRLYDHIHEDQQCVELLRSLWFDQEAIHTAEKKWVQSEHIDDINIDVVEWIAQTHKDLLALMDKQEALYKAKCVAVEKKIDDYHLPRSVVGTECMLLTTGLVALDQYVQGIFKMLRTTEQLRLRWHSLKSESHHQWENCHFHEQRTKDIKKIEHVADKATAIHNKHAAPLHPSEHVDYLRKCCLQALKLLKQLDDRVLAQHRRLCRMRKEREHVSFADRLGRPTSVTAMEDESAISAEVESAAQSQHSAS